MSQQHVQVFLPGGVPSGLPASPSAFTAALPGASPTQRAPRGDVPAAYVVPGYAPEYLPGYLPGTDGLAIVSLVLGLLGVGLGAIVFGHVARHRIVASGKRGGGMAATGLFLGYVTTVVLVGYGAMVGGLVPGLG